MTPQLRADPKRIATGQRRLPRKLRKDAQSVAKALSLLDHPKLARQVDTTRVLTAVDRVNAHLATIDPRDRLWVRIVNVLAWVLLAVVAAGFAYALYLRFLG